MSEFDLKILLNYEVTNKKQTRKKILALQKLSLE